MTSSVIITALATMQSKISFTTMATPELGIAEQVLVAKQYGFTGVDFRMVQHGKGEIPKGLSSQQYADIGRSLIGIQTPGLLCYNQNIHAGQEQMVSSVLEYLEVAHQMNIPMIRVFTGKISTQAHLDALVEVLQQVLQINTYPIKLGLQNHINNGITLKQGKEICQRLQNHPRVGVIASPDQAVLAGEDYQTLLEEIAPQIVELYVADLDQNNEFVLIGDGVIDFPSILRRLYANGFDGYVTLKWEKCWYPELPDYPQAFGSFLDMLRANDFIT